MADDQALDKMMRKVLSDAIALDCEQADGQELSFEPSTLHQKQMRAMLKDPLNWAKRRKRPMWKQVMRRVAAVFLAILIGFGGVMAFSSTARAAVFQWLVEWYETHIVYRYMGDAAPGELPHYEITELPDGYRETARTTGPVWVYVTYESADGSQIYFDYNDIQQGGLTAIVPDGDMVVEVTVNGLDGQLFIPQNQAERKIITWIAPDRNIQFMITTFIDEAEMVAMAESIEAIKID